MLKTDFHIHTAEDKKHSIKYDAKELIMYASKLGFKVLSITNHDFVCFSDELKKYAKSKGILLIPGVEKEIEGKHILIINPPKKCEISKFEDIEKIKNENCLIIAAHPFHIFHSVGNKLIKYKNLFDAAEICHFYTKFFNPNLFTIKISKKLNIPLIGNSDSHYLWQLNSTYSHIDAEKNVDSIFEALRKNKVIIRTKPLRMSRFLQVLFMKGLRKY